MKLEVCTDTFEGVQMARAGGAHRVELCAALSVGGLTPSLGLVERCCAIGGIEIHAMIRLREGDFCYTEEEVRQMQADIAYMAKVGVHGVVFGCLTAGGHFDKPANHRLLQEAKKHALSVTFHRAFDAIIQPLEALETLVEMSFDRLLSTGGAATAYEGRAQLAQYVQRARGRIEVMAGGGVRPENAGELAQTGVDALHFTSHTQVAVKGMAGMGGKNIPNPEKLQRIQSLFAR